MLKNYLKIAFRNLSRHRLFSFINIFGLALSMSLCMMVMIRVKKDLSYDDFHPHADRTYRIISEVTNQKGDRFNLASTPMPLHQALGGQEGLVEEIVQLYPAISEKAEYKGKRISVRGAFTDPSFFKVFGFPLSVGNEGTALQMPNSIVLSKETAEKFFGSENPIGKILSFEKIGSLQVTGLLETSGKSHIGFDAYVSAATVPQLEKSGKLAAKSASWDSFELSYTYVRLSKNASVKQLNISLDQIVSVINAGAATGKFGFRAQAIRDITPSSTDLFNDISGGASWAKIWTEIGVAVLILVAACFNYTNLTIARALTRAKEVGIRKVSGALRGQVFTQYIIESIVIALFALGLALVFLQLILQYEPFNDGYEFVPSTRLDLGTFLWFLLFAFATGIIAGAAPAWILSAFKPVQVLKNIATHKLFGNVSMQKALIVFQFSLSLIIVIFLSAFYRQFSYMGEVHPGFRNENIITVQLDDADASLFANEARHLPGVENVSAASGMLGDRSTGTVMARIDKNAQPIQLSYFFGDQAMLPTMGLQLAAGSNFSMDDENVAERYVLLNELAVKTLSFKNNSEAINKIVTLGDSTQLQIVGVVKDFFAEGAARPITPMAIRNRKNAFRLLNVQVAEGQGDALLPRLEASWKKTFPGRPFNSYSLEKQLKAQQSQRGSISLLGFLAFMTIAIASLGLLGLVIYTVETRRKEISIRKVIGAEIRQLIILLSGGFTRLLLIAGCIAMPIGYALSFFFLQNFPNRVHLGLGWLFVCFGFLLSIGLVTILSQTWKASAANPADHLKTE